MILGEQHSLYGIYNNINKETLKSLAESLLLQMKVFNKIPILSGEIYFYFLFKNIGCWFQVYLQTTQGKGSAYLYDIHFWIGKDTSQVSLHFTLPYFQLLSCSIQFLRKVIVSSFVFMFLPVSLFFPFVFSFWF